MKTFSKSLVRYGALISGISILGTSMAYADNKTPETINEIFSNFTSFNVTYFFPVLIIVAFITFLAGVLAYVRAGDNEEKREAGREVMVFGIVVLFIMIAFWGFVGLLTQTFFGSSASTPNYLPILSH